MAKKKPKAISDAEFIEMVGHMLEVLTPKQLCEDPLDNPYVDPIAWSEGKDLPTGEDRAKFYDLMMKSDVWDNF